MNKVILVRFFLKMISYNKVCEILTEAVPMTTDFCPPFTIIPSDDIPTEGISDSRGIKEKVQENYDKWANDPRHSISSELVCRGYWEIDDFTGNELLRILCNIISKKIDDGSYAYEPGNVLYFSRNRNAYAAIMFTKTKPVITVQLSLRIFPKVTKISDTSICTLNCSTTASFRVIKKSETSTKTSTEKNT